MASESEFQALISFIRHEWVETARYPSFFAELERAYANLGGDHRWRYYEYSHRKSTLEPDDAITPMIRLVNLNAVRRTIYATPFAEEWDAAEVVLVSSGTWVVRARSESYFW